MYTEIFTMTTCYILSLWLPFQSQFTSVKRHYEATRWNEWDLSEVTGGDKQNHFTAAAKSPP